MKYLFVFAIIIVFSYKLIEAKTKQEAIDSCVKKLNVNEAEYLAAKRNNFNGVTRNIQCLVNCVFEDLGLSNNGVIQDAKLQQFILSKNDITTPVAKQLITKCKKEMTDSKSTDKCFNANAFRQCIRKNKPSNANSNSKSAGRVNNSGGSAGFAGSGGSATTAAIGSNRSTQPGRPDRTGRPNGVGRPNGTNKPGGSRRPPRPGNQNRPSKPTAAA